MKKAPIGEGISMEQPMDPSQIPQATTTLLMDAHIQTAIWAIFTAVAFTLVVLLTDMVKQNNAGHK